MSTDRHSLVCKTSLIRAEKQTHKRQTHFHFQSKKQKQVERHKIIFSTNHSVIDILSIMTRTSRLLPSSLLLAVLSLATRFTSASVAIAESSCTNFTFPEDGHVRELCYSIQVMGPSIAITTLPNGTDVTEYVGDYSETYIFERDLEGIVTEIKWDEAVSLVDCVATVSHDGVGADDTMECKSCALCDDQGIRSVSADCTNLEQGRNVSSP